MLKTESENRMKIEEKIWDRSKSNAVGFSIQKCLQKKNLNPEKSYGGSVILNKIMMEDLNCSVGTYN